MAASTADDVLAGIDLAGKNVVVTGGHAGIGLEVSRALSKAGASVTATSRHPTNVAASLAGVERIEVDRGGSASADNFAICFNRRLKG